jgi:hypothetical protein
VIINAGCNEKVRSLNQYRYPRQKNPVGMLEKNHSLLQQIMVTLGKKFKQVPEQK